MCGAWHFNSGIFAATFEIFDILQPCTFLWLIFWFLSLKRWQEHTMEGEEVRSANYFIKLLPCGPLLLTWESTFRKLTSISNNCFFFYILLLKTPQKSSCYRFKVDGQTSVNDSFSCCKIDWRMALSKFRHSSASSPLREKFILLRFCVLPKHYRNAKYSRMCWTSSPPTLSRSFGLKCWS